VSDLKVEPEVLHRVGTVFERAGSDIAGMGADAPLGEAVAAVPQLKTADACRKAEADVAAQTTAAAEAARGYGEKLKAAARWYEMRDAAAANAIKKIAEIG